MKATPHRRSAVLLSLVLLVLAGAQPAIAFQPANQNNDYEILLPQFDWQGHRDYSSDMERLQAERDLEDAYGGNWRVFSWNPRTGTPHYVYGTPVRMASQVTGASGLETLARAVIADHPELFRAAQTDLRVSGTPHALGKWVAHFQQTYHGLDIWEARALVAFSDDGRLLLMGSDCYGDIALDPNPSIGDDAAVLIAQASLPFNPATDHVEDGRTLLVLPYPLSESEVEHHLVWRVRVRTENPLGIWVTHIDAHDGTILWRYNDIHFAYGGDTESEVQPDTYCNGLTTQAMPHLNIDVSGVGTATSDENGDWTIAGSGGNRTVSCDLEGPYCHVYENVAGPEAFFSGTASEDTPFTVRFDDTNAQHDERDVFDGVNDVHDFFQLVAPEFGYAHQQMGAEVSINSTCNAYWDGNIHFFHEGGGCGNTGEIQQVVHHEFGHGVQWSILGWQGDEGLGEGNSDILGNLLTQESIIGLGFYLNNCTSGIRNSDNDLVYPDDVVGQGIHYAGQVIAGFHWDSMMALQDAFGTETGTLMMASTWHYGRVLLHPTMQPDQVFATFFADDDDGDLDNGTPNYGAYCAAAMHHGFECPPVLIGVIIEHEALTDTDETGYPYGVSASFTSTYGDIDPSTVKIYWRFDGGTWIEEPMTPSGMGGEDFGGMIPAQSYGQVEYYLYAEDVTGESGTLPLGAPAGAFSFDVAWFVDKTEQIGDWVAGDPADTATEGIWENVDPVGTIAQPDDDHSVPGAKCWVTGQHEPGQADNWNDVDGGITTLYSPVFDLSQVDAATLRVWYWFSNNLGDNPGAGYMRIHGSNNGGESFSMLSYINDPTNSWRSIDYDLVDIFDEPDQFQLKIEAKELILDTLIEAAIDDIVILAELGGTGVEDGLSITLPVVLDQNVPNPFNPVTEIRFQLEKAGPAALRIYDAQGRMVRELASGHREAGAHTLLWDGRNAAGESVASGVYLYRLETVENQLQKQMVLIK